MTFSSWNPQLKFYTNLDHNTSQSPSYTSLLQREVETSGEETGGVWIIVYSWVYSMVGDDCKDW